MKMNPVLKVYTGCMFSSKTSRLLMDLERFKHQHRKAIVFKPAIDTRYSTSDVVTHSGWSVPAITVSTGPDIIEALANIDGEPDVVAVDEAFMIDNVADVLVWLYRSGKDIIVSTLDVSAQGKPFKEVERLLIWATHVEKCTAVCTVCGQDARYTHKKQIDDDQAEICIGGDEMYEPRCHAHFPPVALMRIDG